MVADLAKRSILRYLMNDFLGLKTTSSKVPSVREIVIRIISLMFKSNCVSQLSNFLKVDHSRPTG